MFSIKNQVLINLTLFLIYLNLINQINSLKFERSIPNRFELLKKFKPRKDLEPNRVILNNEGDIEYYSYIYLGTPPQPLKVKFDPGYSKSWFLSVDCTSMGSEDVKKYDRDLSETFKPNGTHMNYIYGDINLKTILSYDSVRIAGLTMKNFIFPELMSDDGELFQGGISAVIGLGLNNGSDPKTFVEQLYDQKLINKNIISMYLNRSPSSTFGGEITLGDINKKYFDGEITYLQSLSSHGAWKITLDGITAKYLDEKPFSVCKDGCQVTIDFSEAPFIMGPEDDIGDLNNAIGAKPHPFGGWYVDCSLIELANVTITLGGRDFHFSPNEYIVSIEGTCYSAFEVNSREDIDTDWIFSYPISGPLYTVFDYENKKIGFAESIFS